MTLAKSWGTELIFRKKSNKSRKKNIDEIICEDDRLTDSEHYFKTAIFYHGIDTVISQLPCRFEGMNTISCRFNCIHPYALLKDKDDMLYSKAKNLVLAYSNDLSPDFPS